MEPILLHAWSPSYYTRGALKTWGGCRASIAPAWSRRVDAWTRVRVDAWTRGHVNRPIFNLFFILFLLKINHTTSQNLYRSYCPHQSRDSLSPVCGIFFFINHATSPKLYRSYYPHRSRDSMSPLCRIFYLVHPKVLK